MTQKAAAGAKRIFDILDHVSSVPEPTNPVHIGKASGAWQLEPGADESRKGFLLNHLISEELPLAERMDGPAVHHDIAVPVSAMAAAPLAPAALRATRR